MKHTDPIEVDPNVFASQLSRGGPNLAQVVRVVRNHHDTMPGKGRDRPGIDRICVRLAGESHDLLLDVWSRSGLDIASAHTVTLTSVGGLVVWSPAGDDARAA